MRAIRPLQVVEAHRSGVWALCPCPGNRLVSAGGDGLLKVWEVDPRTGSLLFLSEVSTPHTEVLLVHRSQHGVLIAGGHHGGLSIWELDPMTGTLSARQRLNLSEDREEHTDRLLETRSGHLLSWVIQASPLVVWRWSEAEKCFVFQQVLPVEGASVVLELPSGELLTGDDAGRIRSWWWDDSKECWQAREELYAHEGPLHALLWMREDTLISAGGDERVLKLWRWSKETRPRVPTEILHGHRSRIDDLVESGSEEFISLDQGSRLLVFGWRHRPEMRVWRRRPDGLHLVQQQEGLLRRCLEGALLVEEQDQLCLWRRDGEAYAPHALMTGGHQGMVLTVEPLPSGGFVTGGLDGNLASWSL